MMPPLPNDLTTIRWQGAGPGDACPKVSVALLGWTISPEQLEERAARYAGLGIRRYLVGAGESFRLMLCREEVSGLQQMFEMEITQGDSAADIGIGVGTGAPLRARRRFRAADEDTAVAFLLALISQLQGEGGICVDMADLLHAWRPGIVHDLCRINDAKDRRASAGAQPVTLFVLADADCFCLALVEAACRDVWRDAEPAPELLIGHVLLAPGEPVGCLLVLAGAGGG